MKIKDGFKYGDRFEIEYILENILEKDKMFIHLNPEFEFNDKVFLEIIELRKNGYPIEYIFEEVYFYGEQFYIKEGVLIPRDDTEPLIDISLRWIPYYVNQEKKLTIAEIGVGSGIISTIIAKKFQNRKDITFIATDINPIALEVTKQNLAKHNVDIKLYLTNLLDGVEESIDIIISNPPYVEEEWENEQLKYEPKEAIFAKDNGTYLLKKIVKEGIRRGVKLIICEMGYNQKELMKNFFDSLKLNNYSFYKDLSGNDRGFILKF